MCAKPTKSKRNVAKRRFSHVPCSHCGGSGIIERGTYYVTSRECKHCKGTGTHKPTDTEMLDYLASMWNSQGEGHCIMGRRFYNPTGSFRDAVMKMMRDIPLSANAKLNYAEKE